MGSKKRRHSLWSNPSTPRPKPDLNVLGSAIIHVPADLWEERMFFHGAPDLLLQDLTGHFPATIRGQKKTHPIFVLKTLPQLGRRVCPCSTKNWQARRYIQKGCRLDITGKEMDQNSYLVENCAFNLPLDPAFTRGLMFMGRAPQTCIKILNGSQSL